MHHAGRGTGKGRRDAFGEELSTPISIACMMPYCVGWCAQAGLDTYGVSDELLLVIFLPWRKIGKRLAGGVENAFFVEPQAVFRADSLVLWSVTIV